MERLTGHAELQELLGAYALDAVDPEEASVIELHLSTCPRCRTELADHREVAALLGYAGGSAPRGVWDRIISSLEEPPPALELTRAQLDTVTPRIVPGARWATSAPGGPGTASRPGLPDRPAAGSNVVPIDAGTGARTAAGSPGKRSRWSAGVGRLAGGPSGRLPRTVPIRLMVAVATTAALIVAALGIEVGRLEGRRSSQVNLASLAYQVATAQPSARHLTLISADGARTVQAVIVPGGETYLGPGDLQVLPSSETYQMWGIVDGNKVSLGVIGDNATYASFTTPPVATALAMTVEARGGVVATTKTPVVEGLVPD